MTSTKLSARGLKPVSELALTRAHGDRLRYLAGCRCDECRGANTAYERTRQAARKAGDWNGIVPATKARAHMNKHAQNLRTMLALLPVEVCHVYRDTIYSAAAELDRLDAELAKHGPIWATLTSPGQIKVGDRVKFELGGNRVKRTVGEVLHQGTDREEVIYDQGRNYYFITSMALGGTGQHKNVQYLPKLAD